MDLRNKYIYYKLAVEKQKRRSLYSQGNITRLQIPSVDDETFTPTQLTHSQEQYYLPLRFIDEAYQTPANRTQEFSDGWRLADGDDEHYVYYTHPDYPDAPYIAIRGTNFWDARDMYSDLGVLMNADDGMIVRNVDDKIKALMDTYPNQKFNLASHSLGSSQSNIIHDRYKDRVKHSYLFNGGSSPVGFKGYYHDNETHYHIKGDVISKWWNLQTHHRIAVAPFTYKLPQKHTYHSFLEPEIASQFGF